MKNKFKVGDKIKGIKGNGYPITNEQMLEAEVVEIFGNEMDIKVKNHNDAYRIGSFYIVPNSTEEFELIKFTKSDLQNGDRVYDSDPRYGCGVVRGDAINYGAGVSLDLDKFNDDLTHISVSRFDIIKVERPFKYETVFVREEEIKELTMEEVCEMAGCTVKIVDKKEETK